MIPGVHQEFFNYSTFDLKNVFLYLYCSVMSFYKNAGGIAHPTTKSELEHEIKVRLDREQTNLNDIDTSRVTDMSFLFQFFNRIQDIDISKWDVSNVKSMAGMFYNCYYFNSDLSKWDVSNVCNMSNMFDGCENFNCDLSKWNTGKVKYMDYMFSNCRNFNSDLSEWDVSRVKDMNYMFWMCVRFYSDLSKWDVRNVRSMDCIFRGCNRFSSDLPGWL